MTSDKLVMPIESLETSAEMTDYTITLEPHNRNWLLLLDVPNSLPPDASMKHDRQVLSAEPVRTRMRYEGHSSLQYKLGETLSDRERALSLQLIKDKNPKSHRLAEKWVGENKSPAEIVQAALIMFKEQPFVYTLAPLNSVADQ